MVFSVTADSVHLKVQGKKYYDFKLHLTENTNKRPFDIVQFQLRNLRLLLLVGTSTLKAKNTQSCLNAALLHKCELTLEHFSRGLTMIAYGAVVMARDAKPSVSSKFMSRMRHV